MDKDRLHAGIRIVGAGLVLWSATACDRLVSATQIQATDNKTKTLEFTPTGTFTPIPSRTPPPPLTPTLILTPTPDWKEINEDSIETALDEETITLRQIALNRVLVLHIPRKDLIYGALTNEIGETQVLFENFDCEFIGLRDNDLLGEKEEVDTLLLPADAWDISGVVFDQVEVKKTSELPGDIEVFESESFILNGKETICPEVPVIKPATDFARRMYDQAKEIAIEIINRLSQTNPTPSTTP